MKSARNISFFIADTKARACLNTLKSFKCWWCGIWSGRVGMRKIFRQISQPYWKSLILHYKNYFISFASLFNLPKWGYQNNLALPILNILYSLSFSLLKDEGKYWLAISEIITMIGLVLRQRWFSIILR